MYRTNWPYVQRVTIDTFNHGLFLFSSLAKPHSYPCKPSHHTHLQPTLSHIGSLFGRFWPIFWVVSGIDSFQTWMCGVVVPDVFFHCERFKTTLFFGEAKSKPIAARLTICFTANTQNVVKLQWKPHLPVYVTIFLVWVTSCCSPMRYWL